MVEKHPELLTVRIAGQSGWHMLSLTDQGLASLCQLKQLKVLHLEKTEISGENLEHGADNSTLSASVEKLCLASCVKLTDLGLNRLLLGNRLRELDLRYTFLYGTEIRNGNSLDLVILFF